MKKNVFKLFIYTFIVVFVCLTLYIFPKWTVDDAYISFRYADNLAQYGQLTFNLNEDPVEGYTGILLPLLIAGALKLGVLPTLASHFIGVFAFLSLLLVFYRILINMQLDFWTRITTLILFSTASFQYTHVFSGMETMLFTFLLYSASLQLMTLIQSRTLSFKSHILHAITLLLLSLCRPEGAVYTLIAFGSIVIITAYQFKSYKPLLAYLIFLLIPGVLYFIWRLNYYGYLLPNTFYAKSNDILSTNTLRSMFDFGMSYLLAPLLFVLSVWSIVFWKTKKWIHEKYNNFEGKAGVNGMIVALIIFTIIIIIQYMRSSLTMNFSYRFFVPLYPVALILFAWSLSTILNISDFSKHILSRQSINLFLIAMLVFQTGFHIKWMLQKEFQFTSDYKTKLSEMHIPVGRYLNKRVSKDEWLVVHIDAGAIPFYSQLKTVDFGNLNDEYLAHNKMDSMQKRVDYFYSKIPAALVFTSYQWNCLSHGPEAEVIIKDVRFRKYALVKKYRSQLNVNYYEFVFLRRDLINSDEEINILDKPDDSHFIKNNFNCNLI